MLIENQNSYLKIAPKRHLPSFLLISTTSCLQRMLDGLLKVVHHLCVQVALIALQSQDVISSLFSYLFCYVFPTTSYIYCHSRALYVSSSSISFGIAVTSFNLLLVANCPKIVSFSAANVETRWMALPSLCGSIVFLNVFPSIAMTPQAEQFPLDSKKDPLSN
jgi:hypothetical protein